MQWGEAVLIRLSIHEELAQINLLSKSFPEELHLLC